MSLVKKTEMLRVRLDPDLYERFQRACDSRRMTVSHAIRQGVMSDVVRYEQSAEYKRLEQRSAAIEPDSALPMPKPAKTPPEAVKSIPKGNREERRAAKKRGY